MKPSIELLAPGGDVESIKAAILAGADAIYCGLTKFNARNRASNIELDQLHGVIHLAHEHDCKVFLTLNILVKGSEIPALFRLLNTLVNLPIDGVIVQDLGLFYLIDTYFKTLDVHASTQVNTHNSGQIKFLSRLGISRVNLSRELSLDEISTLTHVGHENKILTEVFVHGSLCLSFSGLCYMSSVLNKTSGNRGQCSQPCRDQYVTTPQGKDFPLNLKDNSAYFDLEKIIDATVASIKIEGRIKRADYVYTVVKCLKNQITHLNGGHGVLNDDKELYKVFNRDFSNGYLKGEITESMFIDNPRDHSIKKVSKPVDAATSLEKETYYEEKEKIVADVNEKIQSVSIEKIPIKVAVSGKIGEPLKIHVQLPNRSFVIVSKINLIRSKYITQTSSQDDNTSPENYQNKTPKSLSHTDFLRRLSAVKETKYYIDHLDLDGLGENLFLSFNEFTKMKNQMLFILNGSKETIKPVKVPFLKKEKPVKKPADLSILISDPSDIQLCRTAQAEIFFQLPNCFKGKEEQLAALFIQNPDLIPWFPAVLIKEHYTAAVKFIDLIFDRVFDRVFDRASDQVLNQVRPAKLVTDNSGIAEKAIQKKIPWVAGPGFNIVNSFGLLALKDRFACSGAFISNEINKHQIKRLINPANFKLYYRLYHPINLLTSRQCLHQTVTGCEKKAIDEECLKECHKSSTLTTMDDSILYIEKAKGRYHCLYYQKNFLNTQIVQDIPLLFSNYLIDLRNIKTSTSLRIDKEALLTLFKKFLSGSKAAKKELEQVIGPTTFSQYKKGI